MSSVKANICGNCKETNASKLCSGCKSVNYCDRNCQSLDWQKHRKICKILRREKKAQNKAKIKQNKSKQYAAAFKKLYQDESKSAPKPNPSVSIPETDDEKGNFHARPQQIIKHSTSNLKSSSSVRKGDDEDTKDNTSSQQQQCPPTDTQYHARIMHILQLSQKMDTDKGKNISQHIDSIVNIYYEDKGGINQFWFDYNAFIGNVDDHNNDSHDSCDIKGCQSVIRNWRDPKIFDMDNTKRMQLYRHSSDETSVVIQQALDILHICHYHMMDLGFRFESDNNGDSFMTKLIAMQKIGDIIPNNFIKSSAAKFITHVAEEDEAENNANDSTKKKKYPSYSSGVRFFYHDYFKQNQNRTVCLPDVGAMENGNIILNGRYTLGTWYISPKYSSLRQEILQGAQNKLSMIQYINTVESTAYKFAALRENIRGAAHFWELLYGIEKGSPIFGSC